MPGGGIGREEDGSMADEEKAAGGIPGPMQQFVNQLRRMTADMESLTGLGGPLPPRTTLPMMPGLPMPGALSSKELKSIATNVKAQRQSIQALQAQLTAFDQQLGGPGGHPRPACRVERPLGGARAADDEHGPATEVRCLNPPV